MQILEKKCGGLSDWEEGYPAWDSWKPYGADHFQVHNEWVYVQNMDSWRPSGLEPEPVWWQTTEMIDMKSW